MAVEAEHSFPLQGEGALFRERGFMRGFMTSLALPRRLYIIFWLLLFPALPVAAHPFDPFAEEKQAELQRVAEYMRQGNTQEALIQTDQAIAKFPKHGPFYTLKAQIFLKVGQTRNARVAIEQALDLTPDYALSYWIRGLIHQQQNNPSAAIGDFNRVLELDDQNHMLMAQAVGSRGMALTDLGRHTEALGDLNRALEVRPGAVAERQFRAIAYLALGRLKQAQSDIAVLLVHEPDNALPHRLQGELWLKREEFKRALVSLDRALTINPKDAQAYRLRANAHQQLGQAAKAHADRVKTCELGDTTTCGK